MLSSAFVGSVRKRGQIVRLAIVLAVLALVAPKLHAQFDVLTAQYNLSRTSSNMRETVLTRSNVNSSQFGKIFREL